MPVPLKSNGSNSSNVSKGRDTRDGRLGANRTVRTNNTAWFRFVASCAVIVTALLTFSVAAQDCDHWSEVQSFGHLYVTAAVDLVVEQSEQSAVCIAHNPNLHELDIQSIDGVLYVAGKSGELEHEVKIHIRTPVVSDIYVDAAARVSSESLTASRLVVESHGSSDIRLNVQVQDLVVGAFGQGNFSLSGAATHQSIEIDGSGAYLAQALASEISQVTVRGAGHVELWVEEMLDVDILGAASVLYGGSPWVSQSITGHGAIGRL